MHAQCTYVYIIIIIYIWLSYIDKCINLATYINCVCINPCIYITTFYIYFISIEIATHKL